MAQVEHDALKQAIMSMDTYGEGNYASTGLSENRDRKTDHGLTLPPKIQSSDPWPLNAAFSTEGLEDFEILLGGFGPNNPFDDSYQRVREDSWVPTFALEPTEERPQFTGYPSEEPEGRGQGQEERLPDDDELVSTLNSLSNRAKFSQKQQPSTEQPSITSIPSSIPSPRPSPQLLPSHCKKAHNQPTVKRTAPPSSNYPSPAKLTKPASTGDEVSAQKYSPSPEPTLSRRDSGYGISISDSAHDTTLNDQSSIVSCTGTSTFEETQLDRTPEHILVESETCEARSVHETSVDGHDRRSPSQDEKTFADQKNDLIAKLNLKTIDNSFPCKPSPTALGAKDSKSKILQPCDIPVVSIEKDVPPTPPSRNPWRNSSSRSKSLKANGLTSELHLRHSLFERSATSANRASDSVLHGLNSSTHKNSFLTSSSSIPLQTFPPKVLPNTRPTTPSSPIHHRLFKSLPIQLILAMSDPFAKDDTKAIILDAVKYVYGNGQTELNQNIHTIPDDLLASLNKLKWKFETDYQFRKSSLWWFVQNIGNFHSKSSSFSSSSYSSYLFPISLHSSFQGLLTILIVDEAGTVTSHVLPPATEENLNPEMLAGLARLSEQDGQDGLMNSFWDALQQDEELRSYALAAQKQLMDQDALIQSLRNELQQKGANPHPKMPAAMTKLKEQDVMIKSLRDQLQQKDSAIKSYDEQLGELRSLKDSRAPLVRELNFYKTLAERNGNAALVQDLNTSKENVKMLLEERQLTKTMGRQAIVAYKKQCGEFAQQARQLAQQLHVAQQYIAAMQAAASMPTPPPTNKRPYAAGPANQHLRKKLCIERGWMKDAPNGVINEAVSDQFANNQLASNELVDNQSVSNDEVNDQFANNQFVSDEFNFNQFVGNEVVNNQFVNGSVNAGFDNDQFVNDESVNAGFVNTEALTDEFINSQFADSDLINEEVYNKVVNNKAVNQEKANKEDFGDELFNFEECSGGEDALENDLEAAFAQMAEYA
jgi:hypothetical protein